uniref:Preprotein translocase SecG subunit n=1 Tax=Bangiopsis subsimplex TaxID=139980 RepID=A0A1C9CCT9_9RHOD|nr:hypothetical protein Bangp_126 [Bangiopsis subsimplex]AOM66208.1 hypothetical protein Bangp_126 [Bangiopsis subsimplex]ARO90431.1 preprotein translocase SecG subunit [Bangiopsis subsimplex]
MIQFLRLAWYLNMLILIYSILKQEPKLKGINNLSQREKGFSVLSNKEKQVSRQTWFLTIVFVTLTIVLAKIST